MISRYRPVARNYSSPEGPKFEGFYAPLSLSPKERLRVVSYNINFGKAIVRAIDAFRRYEPLAAADLIFLQEMNEHGTEQIARQLLYNYIYYPACIHNYHGRNFGNAILSKWPLFDPEKIILPGFSPLNREMRLATKARMEVGKREIVVYSTHTEVYLTSRSHRRRQVETIIADIPEQAEYVIVGGDFNTVSNRGIQRLVNLFAQADMQRASKGSGSTMVSYAYRPTAADHIFVRGFKTLDRGAIRRATASDHAPVWVEVEWEEV